MRRTSWTNFTTNTTSPWTPRAASRRAGATARTQAGTQPGLFPGGEENPLLHTMDGVLLYRWDGGKAVRRTAEEIEADRAAMPEPPPTAQEQLRADVDFLAALQGVSL